MDNNAVHHDEAAPVVLSPAHGQPHHEEREGWPEEHEHLDARNLRFQQGSYPLALAANLPNLPAIAAIACLSAAIAPALGVTVGSFHFSVTSVFVQVKVALAQT